LPDQTKSYGHRIVVFGENAVDLFIGLKAKSFFSVNLFKKVIEWNDWGERHGRWVGITTWAECLAVERCGSQPSYNPHA